MAWQREPSPPREQESTRQQVLEAMSSCSTARYSKLHELRSGCLPWKEPNRLFTAFQTAWRASSFRRGRIPVLTRLCSFSLALGTSLPAGLEQWHRVLQAANRRSALPLHTQRLQQLSAFPQGILSLLEDKEHERGSRSPAEHTHTPCCFPSEERRGQAHPRGNPPSAALAPGTLGSHQHTNDPERLVKDRPAGSSTPVLPHTAGAAGNTRLWLSASASCAAVRLLWQHMRHCQVQLQFWAPNLPRAVLPSSAHRAERQVPFPPWHGFLQAEAVSD